MSGAASDRARIFTIGHSTHTAEAFLALLQQHGIEVVVDTRSMPYSRYSPQFSDAALKHDLLAAGIKYVFFGRELGGRPAGSEFYDKNGHVLYYLVAETPLFQEGIARLERGIREFRTALLCSEENPAACHRRLLVGRVLHERGVEVIHIRQDGSTMDEDTLAASLEKPSDAQLGLFEELKEAQWKSTPSVSPKKRPRSFSAS